MDIPFVGSDAIAAGRLTPSQLRHRYRALYRGVYVPNGYEASLRDRIIGASLACPTAVITGIAASALHGAKWVSADVPIEVVARVRRQDRLIVRKETLHDDEITAIAGISVATPARAAFDLARHLPRDQAVRRLDALMNARPFSVEDVTSLAKRHRGARGLRRLRVALPLVDGGAESPRETWLRLLFIDGGLPCPTTQYVVFDENGRYVRRLDMVWEDFRVAAEYDGEQHLTSRGQYVLDVQVSRVLQRLGWHVIHVIKEDWPTEVVAQARTALTARGWRPRK